MINNFVYAWRHRGTDHAQREIGQVLTRHPRWVFPAVELRERTRLPRGIMYRTLNDLVNAEWVGVDTAVLDNRRQNVYFITERGKHLFPTVLANHDIHSGDKSCRQVWSNLCASNAWIRSRSSSSARRARR